MNVRFSRNSVKRDCAPCRTLTRSPKPIQKALLNISDSADSAHDRGHGTPKRAPQFGVAGKSKRKSAVHAGKARAAGPAKGRRPLSPRSMNTLRDEEESGPGDMAIAAPSPDFVASKYQRVIGDSGPGSYVPDWVSLVTGSNKAECLVLAKIAYWFSQTKRGKLMVKEFRNGRWWLYKTYRQLAKDTGVLTPDEVRWAVRTLESNGLLIADHDAAGGKPKLYRIDPAAVEVAVEAAERRLAEAMRRNWEGDDDEEPN